ncbi:MAG: PhoPQ-activated pathogenicity-related family protein, partial [Planctomycetaceae bacterium]|nr:PhoPQ-activated pathogenicity-related family protein [Planctomycetaceae bacterium]
MKNPILFFAVLFCSAAVFGQTEPPEFDAYINKPDDSFEWKILEKKDSTAGQTILAEMTSQTWHGIAWKHFLLINVPNKVSYPENAVLYIGGGRIGRQPNQGDQILGSLMTASAQMPIGMLFQVPNQPLFGDFYEDALIGETLLKAIATGDKTYPLLLPMAKSAIRGLDAIQQILKQEKQMDIKHFTVTGASKRGWTTWLTAATKDKRVQAIAPIVIDTLNMVQQMEYQIETWGDFSPSIHDYTERNLFPKDLSKMPEKNRELVKIIDPYTYRNRYTVPKLLVHGTNDPYWTVDAVKNYWDDIPGVKYILTLPNAGHDLNGEMVKAVMTLSVFARYAAEKEEFPEFTWKLKENENDYTERNLFPKDLSKMLEKNRELVKIIDPYTYRNRYTVPKLLVHGTNDPY